MTSGAIKIAKDLYNSLKSSLKEAIEAKEIDAHINDDEFAKAVANEFMDIIRA